MGSIIFGAGTYGEVYLSYLQETGVNVVGFVDDNPDLWGQEIGGIEVLGGKAILSELLDKKIAGSIYCPIGNNKLRVEILSAAKRMGYITPNFIHHTVNIARNVKISDSGVYILQGTTIMPHVVIEDFVMISISANIIHHSRLCKGVFVSNGVNLGANITALDYAYIGMGSTVMTGVKTIGIDSLVGAGAVVIKDVPDYAVVAGVPAKIIKYKNQDNE